MHLEVFPKARASAGVEACCPRPVSAGAGGRPRRSDPGSNTAPPRPRARGARRSRHALEFLSTAGPHRQKKTGHAHEQSRLAVQTARAAWATRQPTLDPARLIFLDETGLTTKLARWHGRCRRGERLGASLPHGHWRTTPCIAGLRADGLTAPMLLPGALDGLAFRTYVEQVLERFTIGCSQPAGSVVVAREGGPQGCHEPIRWIYANAS